jgi:acyl-homoserine-lactone acylase
MRTLRSIRMMSEQGKTTLDQLIDMKHSTVMELAERTLPDMIAHARANPTSPGVVAAAEAMRVLTAWDHKADVDSKGAALFQAFVDDYLGQGLAAKMRIPFDINKPNETATGLKDPEAALVALAATATRFKTTYGSLETPYGEIYRFKTGNLELPGNGGAGNSGLFRTITYGTRSGNKFIANHGETIVCGVQFTTPQVAQCLLGYGNASQPGNPHQEDVLQFMVQKKLLPVLREKADIERNLEAREQFPTAGGN